MTAESIDLHWLTAVRDSLMAHTCHLVHVVHRLTVYLCMYLCFWWYMYFVHTLQNFFLLSSSMDKTVR